MAKLIFAMSVSLDGYVDHDRFAPDPVLFRRWISEQRRLTASLCGRRLYELMRFWEEGRPEWSEDEKNLAAAWRRLAKLVASRTPSGVGPNATLVTGALETEVRRLKHELPGEIDVGGPVLAGALTALGLIDEYRLYLHPVVLGQGRPFFVGPCPPLRLVANERIGALAIRLTYVPD